MHFGKLDFAPIDVFLHFIESNFVIENKIKFAEGTWDEVRIHLAIVVEQWVYKRNSMKIDPICKLNLWRKDCY